MNDIDQFTLRVVNAVGLEPGKVYLIEMDRDKVSDVLARAVSDGLKKYHNISAIVLRTHGGDAIHVRESEEITK